VSVSIRAPLLGNMEERSFPRAFEGREKNYLFRRIFMRNLICKKKKPVNGQLLHRGPCWGNWRGFVYWDFLRLKENAYLGSFFSDPEDIKSLSLAAILNFSKGTGLP